LSGITILLRISNRKRQYMLRSNILLGIIAPKPIPAFSITKAKENSTVVVQASKVSFTDVFVILAQVSIMISGFFIF